MVRKGRVALVLAATVLAMPLSAAEARDGALGRTSVATVGISLYKLPVVRSASSVDLSPRRGPGGTVWLARHCVDGGAPGGALHLAGGDQAHDSQEHRSQTHLSQTHRNQTGASPDTVETRKIGRCGVGGQEFVLSLRARPSDGSAAPVALIRPE